MSDSCQCAECVLQYYGHKRKLTQAQIMQALDLILGLINGGPMMVHTLEDLAAVLQYDRPECVTGTMPEPLTDRALHEIAARLRPATQHEAWVLAKHAAKERGVNGK